MNRDLGIMDSTICRAHGGPARCRPGDAGGANGSGGGGPNPGRPTYPRPRGKSRRRRVARPCDLGRFSRGGTCQRRRRSFPAQAQGPGVRGSRSPLVPLAVDGRDRRAGRARTTLRYSRAGAKRRSGPAGSPRCAAPPSRGKNSPAPPPPAGGRANEGGASPYGPDFASGGGVAQKVPLRPKVQREPNSAR